MGPVYRADYKMMGAERLTGTVDDIYLRCLTVEADSARVVFPSLDLIGLFRDFTNALASRLATHRIELEQLVVATTHSHAAPDTMGAWGPSFGRSGYDREYAEFLLTTASHAVASALETARRPPAARATHSRTEIGDLSIYELPGESFRGIVAGIGTKGRTLFINQVNDSLGYLIPPDQYRAEPVAWGEGHHFTGHELESVGKRAGEVIRSGLIELASD